MKIKRNLVQSSVLLAVACLFLAFSGTAEAAKLLGLTAPDPCDPADCPTADTSRIMLLDTATGTSVPLADTGLVRSNAADAPNGTAGPNALAYNPGEGIAYFASRPGTPPDSAAGPPILYSMVVDQLFGAPPPPGQGWQLDH